MLNWHFIRDKLGNALHSLSGVNVECQVLLQQFTTFLSQKDYLYVPGFIFSLKPSTISCFPKLLMCFMWPFIELFYMIFAFQKQKRYLYPQCDCKPWQCQGNPHKTLSHDTVEKKSLHDLIVRLFNTWRDQYHGANWTMSLNQRYTLSSSVAPMQQLVSKSKYLVTVLFSPKEI